MAKAKAKRTAKAKPKATPKAAPRKEAGGQVMVEVVTRRDATVENRALGVKGTTSVSRFEPVVMSRDEFKAALKSGAIRQPDVLHVREVKS